MAGKVNIRLDIGRILKKSILLFAALALCGTLLAGCKDDSDASDTDTKAPPSSPTVGDTAGPTGDDAPVVSGEEVTADNISQFITLGQYLGVIYDAVVAEAVTDKAIDERVSSELSQWTQQVEVTDRPAQHGDTVLIDFEGFVGDVAFDGGYAEGADLTIGSGQFIPGFEEQIIGHKIGEEFDINVTFPSDYANSPDLAGQPAVFKIALHAILMNILPDLTDEFVQENLYMSSVSEYRISIKEQIEQERLQEADNNVKNQIWNTILNDATIHQYPQSEIDFRMQMALGEIEYMAMMYGVDSSEIIMQYTGMTYDDYIEYQLKPSATDDVRFDLVLRAIAAKEGISISDEEFNEAVAGFVVEYGYEDEEHFLTSVGRHSVYLVLISPLIEELVMSSAVER